jgi:uncharacterized lipoprotein NlpE involved in copper resistance
MRTVKQFKKNLVMALCTACFFMANPSYAESDDAQHGNMNHAQNNTMWSGIYKGFLPCADCMGIKTSLALNANNSYILITQNTGKSVRDFVEKGKFTWAENANTIVLTSRDGATTHQYLIGDNTLTQLDNSGNKVSGKDAERYILHRKDMVTNEAPSSHVGH